MNNLFRMAIVNCLRKLKHNFKNFKFWELALFKSFPVIIKFPSREILHNNNESLLLSLSHRINKLYDVFVLKIS